MSKKTRCITLWMGVALGFTALILGFLCKFGLAFLFMIITCIYAGCFENSWRDTFFRGFEEKEHKQIGGTLNVRCEFLQGIEDHQRVWSKESGLVIERRKLRSEMTPEELKRAREKSRQTDVRLL